jgi:hypothetical protein
MSIMFFWYLQREQAAGAAAETQRCTSSTVPVSAGPLLLLPVHVSMHHDRIASAVLHSCIMIALHQLYCIAAS